jgi:uncharacterized protein YbaP (TraB family)
MKKKRLTAILLLLLPGLASAQAPTTNGPVAQPTTPATTARAPFEPHPAIWLLSDADTRIYIFGTIHALRPKLRWRSATFDRIVSEAQELVLEASDTQMTTARVDFLSIMQMTKSVPILERVSPDRREGLARLLRELQVPEGGFDTFETWGVAAIIGLAQVTRGWGDDSTLMGIQPSAGVEMVLIREFRASHRPISGAEVPTEIIASFRRMPLDAQRAMLEEAVDAYAANQRRGQPYETTWIRGDVELLGASVEAFPPRLHELLLARRNRGFADWLARRLERPGTVLFAVGAGHLAGRDSVQSMLESRGLHVQRIQ